MPHATIQAAANACNVPLTTLRSAIERGEIPTHQATILGVGRVVDIEVVRAWAAVERRPGRRPKKPKPTKAVRARNPARARTVKCNTGT